MRRRTVTLALLLWCAPLAATETPETETLREGLAWIERRIEQLDTIAAAPGGAEGTEFPDVAELRDLLVERGVPEALTDGLLPREFARRGRVSAGRRALVLRRAGERLEAYIAASRRAPPSAHPDGRTRLEEILSDPLFAAAQPRAATLMDRIKMKIYEWFAGLWQNLSSVMAEHGTLIFWVTLVVFVAASVYFVVRLALPAFGPRRRAARHTARPGVTTRQTATAGARRMFDHAIVALDRGEHVVAVKRLVEAAILGLRERRLLPPVPGMTDAECLRALEAAGGDLAPDLARLTLVHDRAVYARRDVGTEDVHQARESAARILDPADRER